MVSLSLYVVFLRHQLDNRFHFHLSLLSLFTLLSTHSIYSCPVYSVLSLFISVSMTELCSLPLEKVFPIQIGTELFRLSGASIASDGMSSHPGVWSRGTQANEAAPSYFSRFFETQLQQNEDLRTLYIDRDPETFKQIALHLQGETAFTWCLAYGGLTDEQDTILNHATIRNLSSYSQTRSSTAVGPCRTSSEPVRQS